MANADSAGRAGGHRFTFGLWTVGNPGRDPFGEPTRPPRDPVDTVHRLADAGAWGVSLHDNDLVPYGTSAAERDRIVSAFKAALSACKDLEPPGFAGSRRSSGQQAAALKFAQCIRENGVSDFPDPVNGQPLVDTNLIPSSATSSGMSILNAAMRKCGGLVAAFVRGQ